MTWAGDILLISFLIICAIAAISMKDLLSAVIILGAYSFFIALVYALLGAVDVAFTEAVVGAGVTTVLFIGAISQTTRKASD
jgi:uncharacterized MnhB-related membrane protein